LFELLSEERRKRSINRDHNNTICEMAEDVIMDDDDGLTLNLQEVDSIMGDDLTNVTDKELDDIENSFKHISSEFNMLDILSMSSKELDDYIATHETILEKI